MSNWWKRFFGLGDEIDEGPPPSPQRTQGFSSKMERGSGQGQSVGRFEDPHRNLEVRMVHKYPESPFTKKEDPPFQSSLINKNRNQKVNKPFNETPIPPPLTRRERRGLGGHHLNENKEREKVKEVRTPQVPSNRRSRFAVSSVPSPIYGYRARPNPVTPKPTGHERQSSNNVVASQNQAPDHQKDQLGKSEERRAFELLSTIRNSVERTQERSSMPQHENRAKTEAVSSLLQRAGDENNEDASLRSQESNQSRTEAPSPFSNQVHQEHLEESPINEANRKEPILVENEKDNLITAASQPSAGHSVVSVPTRDSLDEVPETKRESQSEPDRASRPMTHQVPNREAERRDRPRNPAIPFNVLMYQSDRQAGNRVRRETEKPINKLSVDLLKDPSPLTTDDDQQWIEEKKQLLSESLENFNVKADVLDYVQGPTVTRFEIRLHPGVKVNKVVSVTEDLKLTLSAKQIRIAPIPGKNTVGIEIPNAKRKPVHLKSLLQSAAYKKAVSPLTAVLGQDISGNYVVTDLAKMPHGLIAGATGSGKSVCIHSLILSLIYKATPDELRFILIDPKVVELAAYREMPHLAAPVITQTREAALALKWAVDEMENRYQLFADSGVRDLSRYNDFVQSGKIKGEKLPYIVIVIDELADLMMTSPQEVEAAICRIAQKARAAGIHMLLATQRPSVDVITGLIKSNIPTRIAFSVSSQADSRTILDTSGAERLLGQGDLLFSENGSRSLLRLQGTFVTDEEIEQITDTFSNQDHPSFLFNAGDLQEKQSWDQEEDDLFEEAGQFVIDQGQASVSSLQRRFRIGYNRAARLVDQLEAASVITEANGSKPRQVLMDRYTFENEILSLEKVDQ